MPVSPDLAAHLDHTLLGPVSTEPKVVQLCTEALQWGFKAVCVQPRWTAVAAHALRDSAVLVAVVADFPYGAGTADLRLKQIEQSLLDGAQEVDLVAPLDTIAERNWNELYRDILAARKLAGSRAILKVIIEVSLFEEEQVVRAAETCAQAGAQMIKTSTGILNSRPTTLNDIELIKKGILDYEEVQIKVSGGVKTRAEAQSFLAAGAHRIGTSRALQMMQELE